ncbi:hypothetical protein NDU88_006384 [Pleurodeles waltl]|uniref:Uncharacterized protein n=1 Tax=Pleurodeles waltl TaxID=8319 RepID=A0AAV7VPG4_PLEWA|nr:hypothetical protein NDU88_006384 [Pleurodeles waltl]
MIGFCSDYYKGDPGCELLGRYSDRDSYRKPLAALLVSSARRGRLLLKGTPGQALIRYNNPQNDSPQGSPGTGSPWTPRTTRQECRGWGSEYGDDGNRVDWKRVHEQRDSNVPRARRLLFYQLVSIRCSAVEPDSRVL